MCSAIIQTERCTPYDFDRGSDAFEVVHSGAEDDRLVVGCDVRDQRIVIAPPLI
jgi:hypothetical protein